MCTLVILRHGQTVYNEQKRFCGWTDVDLTEAGREEAHTAGGLLKGHGFEFDVVHSNVLERCLDTATITLNAMGASDTPIETYWRLNERHYGALQGTKSQSQPYFCCLA